MDNLKNFVVSKGLEVADSINTGYIILNGKAVSGLVDSSNVLGLIDSAYISSKSSGVDSSATIALIDSSYVQARESISISSFNTIAVAGQTDIVADSVGLSWRTSTEQAKLISSDFATNDGFARFVDLAGDYAIVSASSYDESPYENNGAAFIFKRTDSAGGTGWAQQAKLVRDSSSHSQSFSWSVSLNESATSALISNGGSSYAITEYTRDSANSTTWAQGQKILPAAGVTPTNTADWARNGAFDRKGNYFVVGADNDYGNGSSGTRYGSAWVYNKDSSGSQWALQQELVPSDDSDGAGTKGYGYAVSIATDSLIVVGADRYYNNTGAVYIFERAGSTWTQTQRLVGQASAASYFGKNVSMDGEYLAVSAPVMTTGTGIVYIYKNLGGTWTFQTSVQASDASTGKYFGNGLALKGSQLLVSAYAANTVYVFQKYGETWLEIKKIVGSSLSDGNTNGKLGGDLPGGLRINKSATDIDFLMGSTNKGAYVFTVPTATGPSNTLTLEAGSGISITTNATTDTVTIAGSAAGLDSAGVTSLIDSAYVQTRQTKYTNADFTDSAYVTTQINSVIDAAPGALDTLNELAAALGDDANFSTTITNQIAGKLDSAATTSLIDSAYVQARAPAGGNDSATTIALIDSSYVQARALASASVTSSATAPSSPSSGDMWFDTTDTSLLVYYADSDGAQWVDISGATGATGPAGPSGSPEIIKIDSDLTTTDSDQVIHSFSKSTYRTIKYTAQLENDDSSGYHAEELLLTHNGTNVAITSYAKLALDSDLGIFDAAINGSNVELKLTPTKVNTHVKLRAITITEGNATPNDINALLIPIDSDLTTTDSDQVIHSFSKSTYRTIKYVAQLKHASSNAYHSQEILLVHNGTFVAMTGYAKLFLDSDLGTFDAAINGSNVELRLTPAKTNTNVKLRAIRTTV